MKKTRTRVVHALPTPATCAAELLHWATWVCACPEGAHAGALASCMGSLRASATAALPEAAWGRAAAAVEGLLSRDASVRRSAALALRDLLHLAHGVLVPSGEAHTGGWGGWVGGWVCGWVGGAVRWVRA